MATSHAQPGEVVDLATWGDELPETHSKTITKQERMELARIILRAGEAWGDHRVDGPIVVQCLSGHLRFRIGTEERTLTAGRLLYLAGGEPHALYAETDSTILLTIVFVG
jgi:quercetin dioxygenase-like cupin family protein